MASDQDGTRGVDVITNLQQERDSFIQNLFKKGAQFTHELLAENTRLSMRVAELESENAQLRSQVASSDAIRELLRKIEGLECERATLVSQYEKAAAASVRWVDQYSELESELANLANLYVASFQLHSSLKLDVTTCQIRELLGQLVGARSFAVYVVDSERAELLPVIAEGVPKLARVPIQADDGGLGETFATGLARIEHGELANGSLEHPVALVPMTVEGQVIGVLAIFTTLPQKPRFLHVDFELFKFFGAHAGIALACTRLFAEAGDKLPSFDGLSHHDM